MTNDFFSRAICPSFKKNTARLSTELTTIQHSGSLTRTTYPKGQDNQFRCKFTVNAPIRDEGRLYRPLGLAQL